jgi:RHS repeat-associated protein
MKTMNAVMRIIAFTFVLVLSASVLMGQVATGTYPYGTFDSPGFDTINVGNLNVHLDIPILHKAGRGIPFTYDMSYDSLVWTPTSISGAMAWQPVLNWGWRGVTEASTGYVSNTISSSICSYETIQVGRNKEQIANGWLVTDSNWVYHDAWGVAHPFAGSSWVRSSTCSGSGSGGTVGPLATDGSGYQFQGWVEYVGAQISDKSGHVFAVPIDSGNGTASVTDTNGNEISVNGSGQFTDTTGNIVLTVAGAPPSPETFTYTDTYGNPQTVTMTYKTYTVQTAFGCSGVAEYGPTATSLVSSISFPDGSTYNFFYETTPGVPANVTGRLESVTLPQGNTISYAYTGENDGIECTDGSTAGLTRTLNSDSGSAASTWTYSRTITGTGTSQTAVVDGLLNNKVYTFVEASNQPSGTTAQYYETSRSIYQGAASGTPVVALATCYNGAAPPCVATIPTLPFGQIDTYKTLDGIATDGTTAMYNANGMQTQAEVWDFGTSSRGALLRNEVWTYGNSIPSAVTEDKVYDGGGNVAAHTLYSYDGAAPTTSSGVPQHVAVTGARGNLTSMTQYASSGTSYTSSFTYEDTGNLLTATTPNGTTTLAYDPTFVYNIGVTLPTPSSGVALSTSASFDTAYTGLQLTSTDLNLHITNIPTYDSMLRPLEIDYPDGGETTWSYTPTTVATTTLINSSSTASSKVQYDGYGRLSRAKTANGQSSNGYYQQDTCYDANGNAAFKSYRYQDSGFSGTSKVCSGAGDSYTYDVLGRLTNVTRANGETRSYSYLGRAKKSVDENSVTRISQVDGLGRITIVCEISSNTLVGVSPTSCGTDITGYTGFITTYSNALTTHTTTITQGAQTRVFQTDWLGRSISVQEPESGTTTYSYAYNSTGLVVTRTRPTANQTGTLTTTTTTQYDSLGRVVSISYTDGTPTKTFAYDTSTGVSTGSGAMFTDLTQANLKGRMSLASVTTPMTLMTAFSYDPVGRTSALDECFPNGCGTVGWNKQLNYAYDLAGDMTSSSDGGGAVSTYNYSPASELLSLTSSISDSTDPPEILSNVQNGPFGPVNYNHGNGLSGVNTYDALGRMNGGWICSGSTSAFCSGGTQYYGFLDTWKGKQVIGECDTALNQCIGYADDEFNRLIISQVNGGAAGPNYGWVYDRYGNRVQQNITGGSGSGSTFTASVNPANNQLVGYSYDAAGNMINDTFHTYTYDAEGNITAVDGGATAAYNYNALNQRVRTSVGGTVTKYVFDAAGKRVSVWHWNGSTYVELKGHYYWGAKPVAYYTTANDGAAATHFEHQDWLGTERMRTTYNGGVEGTFKSLPFGDGQVFTGADTDANHYATLDHDTETDTDHAQFRQYSNTQGRWLSPDPYYGSYKWRNPQSFNRYVYAGNNPLAAVDPSGLDIVCLSNRGGGCSNSQVPGRTDDGWDGMVVTYVDGSFDDNLIYSPAHWAPDTSLPDVPEASVWVPGKWVYETDTSDFSWYLNPTPYAPFQVAQNVGNAPNNATVRAAPPAPQPQKKSYWGCVGGTTVSDALWGSAGTVVVSTAVVTVVGGVVGSEAGPEGTVIGAVAGFGVGVEAAPEVFVSTLPMAGAVGFVHGLIGCAF